MLQLGERPLNSIGRKLSYTASDSRIHITDDDLASRERPGRNVQRRGGEKIEREIQAIHSSMVYPKGNACYACELDSAGF